MREDSYAIIEKRVDIGLMYGFYGVLLSEKRREILEMYYDEDIGLSEIAEALSISRQAAFDAVEKAREQLHKYEDTLHLVAQYRQKERRLRKLKLEIDKLSGELSTTDRIAASHSALNIIEEFGGATHGV